MRYEGTLRELENMPVGSIHFSVHVWETDVILPYNKQKLP